MQICQKWIPWVNYFQATSPYIRKVSNDPFPISCWDMFASALEGMISFSTWIEGFHTNEYIPRTQMGPLVLSEVRALFWKVDLQFEGSQLGSLIHVLLKKQPVLA